jgi:16S rRNA (uracil1498-N3)-methyltransferase
LTDYRSKLRFMSREVKIATRLHVEEFLAPGQEIGLDAPRAHFLRSVLRLDRGAILAVFNARDGEWLARIDALGRGWCSLGVLEKRRGPEWEPDLWLLFAPIKRARIDFLAEKACELGASALQPVMTRFTAVTRVNEERLAANAREAAEQCGRLSLPRVLPCKSFDKLFQDWDPARRILLCAESGPVRPLTKVLADALAADSDAPGRPWAVMTGPEGGFAESELDFLKDLSFVTAVGLGPRILRADTAALAALACWQGMMNLGIPRRT